MKKQLLRGVLLLAAFMLNANLKAQFTETFDGINMPAGWDRIDGGGPQSWKFDNSGNPTGYALIAYNAGAAHDDYLITQQFMVTDGVSDLLKFQAASLDAPSYTDDFFVKISITGKAIGDFTAISAQLVTNSSTLQNFSYDLSDYEGQNVYIAFHAVTPSESDKQGNLILDNVEVSAAPSCKQPINLEASNVTSTTADLAWTENGTAGLWNLHYGAPGFTPGGTDGTLVTGLTQQTHQATIDPDGNYEFYVQADCDAIGLSPWVGPFSFANKYCDFTYSTTNAPSFIYSFKTLNALTNVNNESALGGVTTNGYSDYSSMTIGAFATQEIDFELISSVVSTHGVSIFVDWNNDFIFDASEKIYASTGYATMPLSSAFNIPAGTALGEYRMRVVIDYGAPAVGACSGSSGEAEDYTLEIMAGPSCLPTSMLNASNMTFNSVDLGWTANGTGTTWNIEYGPTGFVQGNGTEENGVVTNPYTLTGLDEGTTYDFYVQTECSTSDQSTWTGPFTFSTLIECGAPTNLAITNVGYDTSVVSWTASSGGTTWIIEYGVTGFTQGDGTEISTTDNPYTLTGLDLETEYDVYIWADCGSSTTSDIVGAVTFTSGNCNTSGEDVMVTVCKNETVDLDTLRGTGSHAGGSWTNPEGEVLTNTEVTLPNFQGIYSYTYKTTSSICDDAIATISITVDPTCDYLAVTIEELMDVSVYPNPTRNILNIVNASNTSSLKIEMLDMNGRVVLVENKALNNATEATLVIDHLEQGIYTLRVYNDEVQKTFKVVKQ